MYLDTMSEVMAGTSKVHGSPLGAKEADITKVFQRWLVEQNLKGPVLSWILKNRNTRKYSAILSPLITSRLLSAIFWAIDYEALQTAGTRRIPLAEQLLDDPGLIGDLLATATPETAHDLAQTLILNQGFEDLTGMTRRVLAKLRQEPARGRSLMHRGREVTFGVYDAQLAIAAALGRRSTQQMLPLALQRAEGGDYDLLAELVLAIREQLGEFQAMPLAMEVASGHSPQRLALIEAQANESLFGDALNFPFPMLAEGLGLVDLGEAFRAPLASDVPALFISGSLDGRTPLANAEALLPGFGNGRQLLVRGASHDDELWLGHTDIAERIADFIAGRPVSDAELEIPPPTFVRNRVDLLLTAFGIGRGTALVAVIAVVALPVVALGLWRRRRRRIRARQVGD